MKSDEEKQLSLDFEKLSPTEILSVASKTIITHGWPVKLARKMFTANLLVVALEDNKGNISRAAEDCGLHRNTMSRLIDEFHLQDKIKEMRKPCQSISLTISDRKDGTKSAR